MRINAHAHIFNLDTVLTREAVAIMVNRIRGGILPDYIVDAVRDLLQEQLERPEYLNEDDLLRKLVGLIVEKGRAAAPASLPLQLHHLGGGTGGLGVMAARAAMDAISAAVGGGGGPGTDGWDVYYTLRVALQPSIPRVAGKLLAHLGPDDAIVALMMDIASDAQDEAERDRLNFRRQIRGTQDAVLAYPGRVLPFIAVNPRREDHYELMRHAVLEDGFLGVKLYPSLGYQLDTAEIRRVLEFCRDHDAPITIHTSATGFTADATTAQYCHPRHWESLLEPNDTLRVCFAHCGGWGGLCGQVHDHVAWAEKIFELMDRYDGVYADISYHVDPMKSLPDQEAYFDALTRMIDAGGRGDRILFGTDSWLLRLSVDDALYWGYFQDHLGEDRFRKVARDAPAKFLGLPLGGAAPRDNIRRHLEWLESRSAKVNGTPAKWVRDALPDVGWIVTRMDAGWSLNNWGHRIAYFYFKNQKPGRGEFEDFGDVRLRQLEYFQRHAGGPTPHLLDMVTEDLVARSRQRARPEGGHTEASIKEALRTALGDPDRTVGDIGRLLDALYLYEPEVM